MNNKIICRIVSNLYHVYDENDPLNEEIEILRLGEMSQNKIVNKLYCLHNKILERKGKFDYYEVIEKVEEIFEHDFSYKKDNNVALVCLYYKEKIEEFSEKFMSSDVICGPKKYKFILLEVFLNVLNCRINKEMYIYHPGDLYSFERLKNHKGLLTSAKIETYFYMKKKKVFCMDEIKNSINDFLKKYSMFNDFIQNIYLFGSYAKNKNDEYSDVDFYIEFTKKDNSLLIFENIFKDYMKKTYNMETDVLVHFKNDDYDIFDRTIMSYAICLK